MRLAGHYNGNRTQWSGLTVHWAPRSVVGLAVLTKKVGERVKVAKVLVKEMARRRKEWRNGNRFCLGKTVEGRVHVIVGGSYHCC
jgi:hypothetical protein